MKIKKSDKEKSYRQLRKKIAGNSDKLINVYFGLLMQDEKVKAKYLNSKKEIYDAFEHLFPHGLRPEDDRIKVSRATTTAEIMKAVTSGRLSFAEAKELMSMAIDNFEAEELPKLLASFEELQSK